MRYCLADVNLWLATIVAEHPHHAAALRWWRDDLLPSDGRVAFCRVTQLGLLRLLTNERVMGSARRSIEEAWGVYQQALAARPVIFAPEPVGVDGRLAEQCQLGGHSAKFWTDSYLAAFARSGGFELVTFDRGFARFPELRLKLLG